MADLNTDVRELDFLEGQLEITTLLDQGERSDQQDTFSWVCRDGQVLFVLADGMGGHAGGALASQVVAGAVIEAFETCSEESEAGHADVTNGGGLKNLLERGSQALHSLREQRPDLKPEPDTTCVLAILSKEGVSVAHLGDSRFYYLAAGQPPEYTEDHSLAVMLMHLGELTQKEAETHSRRNQLIKSVASGGSDASVKQYDRLDSGSALLLCSDGFWDHLTTAEIDDLKTTPQPTETLSAYVKQILLRAGGHADNISAILARVGKRQAH